MSRTTLPILEFTTLVVVLFASAIAIVPGVDVAVVGFVDSFRVDKDFASMANIEPDSESTPANETRGVNREIPSSKLELTTHPTKSPRNTDIQDLLETQNSEEDSDLNLALEDWENSLEEETGEEADKMYLANKLADGHHSDVIQGEMRVADDNSALSQDLKSIHQNAQLNEYDLDQALDTETTAKQILKRDQMGAIDGSFPSATKLSNPYVSSNANTNNVDSTSSNLTGAIRNRFFDSDLMANRQNPTAHINMETQSESTDDEWEFADLPALEDQTTDSVRKPMSAASVLDPDNQFQPVRR